MPPPGARSAPSAHRPRFPHGRPGCQLKTAACTSTCSERERGAGHDRSGAAARDTPRRAATTRVRRCAGVRPRRRPSTGAPPRPARRLPSSSSIAVTRSCPVPERSAWALGEHQQRVLVVNERGERPHRVELVPARRLRRLGERADPVDLASGRLTLHAAQAHDQPGQADGLGNRLDDAGRARRRAAPCTPPPPSSITGPSGEGTRAPALEQDRRPRPRRPVDLVSGVEEGEGERRRAQRSSPRRRALELGGGPLHVEVGPRPPAR